MKLAVIFPGIGYHSDKPLLYFSKKLAAEAEYEIVEIEYQDMPENIKGNSDRMNQAYVIALDQTRQILEDKDMDSYDNILFISKSIGTAVAAGYARKHDLNVRHLFFTPLEGSFKVLPDNSPCIVFHGDKDPWAADWAIHHLCWEKNCPEYLYQGGNHSIETGDAETDLKNLTEIMQIVKSAVEEDEVTGVWIREKPELTEEEIAEIEKRRKRYKRERDKLQAEFEERHRFFDTYFSADEMFAIAERQWLDPER